MKLKQSTLPKDILPIAEKLAAIENEASSIFLEREEEIRGLLLAILSNSNILLLGPPGTAKSALIREIASRIVKNRTEKAKVFQVLMTSYSTIEDLLGPISLKELEHERYVRKAKHSLANSDLAFIDECFKGNAGALNVMLSAMNERIVTEEGDAVKIPLLSLAGASNEVPAKEDGLDALVDRFNLKFQVGYLNSAENWQTMLKNAAKPLLTEKTTVTLAEIYKSREVISSINIPDSIYKMLWDVNLMLRKHHVVPSDRAWVWSLRLLQSEAFMAGRSEVFPTDLVVLKDALWSKPEDMKQVHSVIYKVCQPDIHIAKETFAKGKSAFDSFMESIKEIEHKKHSPDTLKEYVTEAKQLSDEHLSKLKAATAQMTRLFTAVKQKDTADKDSTLKEIEKLRSELAEMSKQIYQKLC